MAGPLVGIVMGSESDWAVMQHAAAELTAFGVAHESRVVSAHRTPDLLYRYAEQAEGTGTPRMGSAVLAASMPGRWAAPPAPAMMHWSPRPSACSA